MRAVSALEAAEGREAKHGGDVAVKDDIKLLFYRVW